MKNEDCRLIKYLLDNGADVNRFPAKRDGTTALTAAINENDLRLIDHLLDVGVDVNHASARFSEGTALEAAVKNENINLVHNLLSVGSDANDPTALLMAVIRQNVEIVNLLLAAHAEDNISTEKLPGLAALRAAVEDERFELIQILLTAGIDANTTLLHKNLYEDRFRKLLLGKLLYSL